MRDLIDAVNKALFETKDDFARWFSGSKIVDENGDPLPVFHGTRTEFSTFKPNDIGLIFFTPDRETAKQFALIPDPTHKFGQRQGRMITAYLHAVNPFDFSDEDHLNDLFAILDYEKVIDEKYATDKSFFSKWLLPEHVRNLIAQGSWPMLENPVVLNTIKRLGHDAMYLLEFSKRTIAVFSPDQIWKEVEQ